MQGKNNFKTNYFLNISEEIFLYNGKDFFMRSKIKPCKQSQPVTLTINKTFAAELPKIDDIICFENNFSPAGYDVSKVGCEA